MVGGEINNDWGRKYDAIAIYLCADKKLRLRSEIGMQEKKERVRVREEERQVCLSVVWACLLLVVWLMAAGIDVLDLRESWTKGRVEVECRKFRVLLVAFYRWRRGEARKFRVVWRAFFILVAGKVIWLAGQNMYRGTIMVWHLEICWWRAIERGC